MWLEYISMVTWQKRPIYCVEHRSWSRSFDSSYHILCWTSLMIETFRIILSYIVLNIAHDRDVSNHLTIYWVEHRSWSRRFESSYHILCWTSLKIETFRIILPYITDFQMSETIQNRNSFLELNITLYCSYTWYSISIDECQV